MSIDIAETLDGVVPASRRALRHEVVKRLLEMIFQGRLPAGTRLMIMKLAEHFGTSSTPCREALVELESIGLVELIHNRGAVVTPFGRQELREIYQIRRILEAEATRASCGRIIDRAAMEALKHELVNLARECPSAFWSQRETASDERLHAMIAAECGSGRLARELRRYDILVQTVREIVGVQLDSRRQASIEHLAIIEAMLAGDAAGAADAMAQHILSAAQMAEAALFGSENRMDIA